MLIKPLYVILENIVFTEAELVAQNCTKTLETFANFNKLAVKYNTPCYEILTFVPSLCLCSGQMLSFI